MEAIAVSKDFKIGRGQIVHAVRDVSFNLYRGAVVALVGESGSGKSTAARLLAGQERLTSGTIKLDGKPVEVRRTTISAATRARSSTSSRTRSPR
jgi:ABC-type oligopeptide transport system, ATPase component